MQENGRSAVTDGMFAFERRAVGSLVSFLHRRSPGRCRLRERPSEYLVILFFDAVVRRRPDNGRPPRVGAQAHIPHDRGRGQRRFGTLPPVEGRLPQSGKAKRGGTGGNHFPRRGLGRRPSAFPAFPAFPCLFGTKKAGWMPALGVSVFRKVRLRWRGARPDSGRRGFSWWLSSQFRRYSTYRDCVRSFRFW